MFPVRSMKGHEQVPHIRGKIILVALSPGLKREHGAAAAQEMHQGLLLLQSQGSRRACYWSCPFCPSCRVGSMKEYLDHIEACHGEVQVDQDGAPTMCMICNLEVRIRHSGCLPACVVKVGQVCIGKSACDTLASCQSTSSWQTYIVRCEGRGFCRARISQTLAAAGHQHCQI